MSGFPQKFLVSLPMIAVTLAACSLPADTVAFKSEQEEVCYNEAQASITNPEISLMRSNDGTFVQVHREGGFVDDIDPSPVFNQCMAAAGVAVPIDPVRGSVSVTFTKEEQAIWETLGDAQKRQALAFKQQGGHLRDFNKS